ncbi:MAG: glycogen synthase GlgA [Defluviitaleaceae bacterium]|nr:glycogen synthase GlgA [Defluviitaleaceae bacterium]MCL2835495.1 glycogen synthase GlgA [Defluviitaleaceae bacterium]
MTEDKLKILFISSEVTPFSKSGGLGEVAAALPKELVKQGVDCRVVTPKYGKIPARLLDGLVYRKSFETSMGWRKQHASVYQLEWDGVITYFIGNDYFFDRDGYYGYGDDHERFGFFSKAAVEMAGAVDFKPDIIHTNDWQTGLAPVYLRDKLSKYVFYEETKSLFTIHNLQYQGVFGRGVLSDLDLNDGYFSVSGLEFYNNISLLKAGIAHSSAVSTVSETYAQEITTPSYGFSMDGVIRSRSADLYGILNGIDYDRNNPETDRHIFENYTIQNAVAGKATNKAGLQKELQMPQRPDVPVLGIISRLTDQKGFDILSIIMDELLNRDVQLIMLGQGDGRYEHMLNYFRWKYPEKCNIYLGFNDTLAQKIYASSDFFLMPSLFEPCGLGQLTAMRYGALPIVRRTGGLADTVQHFDKKTMSGNGFSFEDYLASGLMWAISDALDVYGNKDMMAAAVRNAMSCDYSWESSARKYIKLYNKIIGK